MTILGCGAEMKALMDVSNEDVQTIEDVLKERLDMGVARPLAQRQAVAEAIALLATERAAVMEAVKAKVAGLPKTGKPPAEPKAPKEKGPAPEPKAPAEPKPPKEKKAPKPKQAPPPELTDDEKSIKRMAELVDASDAAKIAMSIYSDMRTVEPEDYPTVLADDRMIRLPVLPGERIRIEAKMKELKFRITDRSAEAGEAGRIMVSAIHAPDKTSIGDSGMSMPGQVKGQKPELPPKDADEKAEQKVLKKFLDGLHRSLHLDPQANPEQSYGAMMLKEALMENIKFPLDYLGGVLKRTYGNYYNMKDMAILTAAMKNDAHRTAMLGLATGYVERMKLLQDTLTPANRIADVEAAFYKVYGNSEDGINTKELRDLANISDANMRRVLTRYIALFTATEDETDQTHRVKKKDPDVPPRLEGIIRRGMNDHRGGKNIEEDDFTAAFGFKGLEFGEWVNQVERQENMNLAYDSLMDLADLTGLDPKAIGLAGKLGMAIGSRGSKNTRAAAHFEPDNNVINLTKTNGNGTVSHEWFHALDRNSSTVQDPSVSNSNAHARRIVKSLAQMLQMRFDYEKADGYLRGLLRQTSDDTSRNKPPKQAVLEAIKGNGRWKGDAFNSYNTQTATAFYANARKMDEGKSERYWSTEVEMLARGAESFLFDLAKGGSPYLTGPSRAVGFMTEKNGYGGTPYPLKDERQYVSDLYKAFFEQFDPKTLQLVPYEAKWTVQEVKDLGWVSLNQHGIDASNVHGDGEMTVHKTKEQAQAAVDMWSDKPLYLNSERTAYGKLNLQYVEFVKNIDKIMEEMGIERWPEVKDGSMAESMFFHMRQGWWPENNQALKVYVAKAHRIETGQVDRIKLKDAQEDFEAALTRYAGQRIVDMRNEGADDRAVYDYLVGLYSKQPNLDVRTGTSTANQAYSTPIPIGFVAGLIAQVNSKTSVFDASGGNGMLEVAANPKRVVAIELDPRRAQNMRLMEIGRVIEGNALKLIATEIRPKETDVVLFNPPFGSVPVPVAVPSWTGTNYNMTKIDHIIAAQGMKAMDDKGRGVIILGAHKAAGAITSTDRVFLNWLYSNYNVVDHFEVNGKLYHKMGADWPLRVLVVAGRKETVSAYPIDTKIDRVMDFDQLWSRANEAASRAKQVVVGAGVKSDGPGGTNQRPGAGDVSPGNPGETAGADGRGGAIPGGGQTGGLGNGAAGGINSGNGRPGKPAGPDTGDIQRGGNGQGRGTEPVGAGGQGGSTGRGGITGRAGSVGLSDLTEADIQRIIDDALAGKTPAPRGGATSPRSGPVAPRGPSIGKDGGTRQPKAQPGANILDGIPGIDDLFKQLEDALSGAKAEKPSKEKKPAKAKAKNPAARNLLAERMRERQGILQIGYDPKVTTRALTKNLMNIQWSQNQLVASMRAAMDLQSATNSAEQDQSAPPMFSRMQKEDTEYAKVEPILSVFWQRVSEAFQDITQRIGAFVTSLSQKFAGTAFAKRISEFAKRFVMAIQGEQDRIPDGKAPIKSEAIDNKAQVVYQGRSTGDSTGIFVPRNQATALNRAFEQFEAENGEIDQYVMSELGYDSIEDMHKGPKRGQSQGLAGYQVDALGLAISSMKRGDGFIIGDDTGVGKGRTAAALIGWAVKNGKIPIFFSYKKDLYSAMHDDITDIGMEGRVKPMPTDSNAVIQNGNGVVVFKNKNDATANARLDEVIKTGKMPAGFNAIFTTYFQTNTANKRRDAISKLVREGKAVLIMDEAHNAAGESGTNKFFMSLLTGRGLFGQDEEGGNHPAPEGWKAPQTTYLTATFAKRPSNMPVYVRTQLRHAADTPEELVDVFNRGGDVMQQIASEMLVESGSMIRRERSYAGVKFGYVTDEENAPRDSRDVDAATTVLRQIVYADRAMTGWLEDPKAKASVMTLAPVGFEVTSVGGKNDTSLSKNEFTSVVHNYVGQLLLATKINKSVEMAVAALNAGQKPVLTLQNTMESALSDYVGMEGITVGDPLPGFGWKSVFKRGLTSARRVVFKNGTGPGAETARVIVPISMMPDNVAAEFHRTQQLIDQFESTLPASPIDALRQELGKYQIVETVGDDGNITYSATKTPPAGVKSRALVAVEVTGRKNGVDYSTPIPTYTLRDDLPNVDIIRGFQGGSRDNNKRAPPIDVVILNSSGSTGISLHASEKAIDQRPRHMIVMQPNPDIAVFKQTTGRVHRTGQVEWPFFTVLATGIPAERRALAMLKKKIGALFSNTSSGEGTTNVDAVDFINQYGDFITSEYLKENPDVAAFIGVKIPDEPAGTDIAKTASGRAALLSTDEQREYFDTIEQRFLQEIEQRNAAGTNALERRALDLQAIETEQIMLEEGMSEDNPFTASAFIGKHDINVIGDIPSPDKVREAVDQAKNGRTPAQIADAMAASMATEYDEARNQMMLSRAELAAEIADPEATDRKRAALMESMAALDETIRTFANRREKTIEAMTRNFGVGNGITSFKSGDVDSSAVVVAISRLESKTKKGNPFSPSNIIFHIQRNVPGRRLQVALSKIESGEYEASGFTRNPDYDNWFAMRDVSGGRQTRYIAHGNLLRARALINGGEIAIFTINGSTAEEPLQKGGIIMPPAYQPAAGQNMSDFTVRYSGAAIDYVMAVLKAVEIKRYGGFDANHDFFKDLAANTKFPLDLTEDQRKAISSASPILRGPRSGWYLDMSPYDGRLTLYVGKDYGKIYKSKALKATIGELSKKRGQAEYEARVPKDAAKIKRMIELIAQQSPITVPAVGADVARALSKQHFDANNAKDAEEDQGDAPSFSRASPFYSELARQLDRVMMKVGSPEAWSQALDAMTKRGVSPDEIFWSGVKEWLGLQTGKVTKQAVQDYLAANGVQVRETTLGSATDAAAALNKLLQEPYGITVEEGSFDDELGYYDEDGEAIDYGDLPQGAQDIIDSMSQGRDDGNISGPAKFQQWSEPGGENYREILLSIPRKPMVYPEPLKELPPGYELVRDGNMWLVTPPGQIHAKPWAGKWDTQDLAIWTALDRINSERNTKAADDWRAASPSHSGGHWDDSTVVAHIRVDDRIGPTYTADQIKDIEARIVASFGRPVDPESIGNGAPEMAVKKGAITQLEANQYSHSRGFVNVPTDGATQRRMFVQELQSDWAKAGREKGFGGTDTTGWTAKVGSKGVDADIYTVYDASGKKLIGSPIATSEKEAIQKQKKMMDAGKEMPAPFVTKTDKWLALTIKRVIKLAVDGGYDGVAFVNGEQSADRYDLSKHVDSVLVTKEPGGKVQVWADRPDRESANGRAMMLRETVPAGKLEEYIGKELAARALRELEGKKDGESVEYAGLDLKVGGEGMKAFYDKIVPNAVNDILRKVGGSKLRNVGIVGALTKDQKSFINRAYMGRSVEDVAKAKAMKPPILMQPGFDITDAMREKASGGLPMFVKPQFSGAAQGQATQAVQSLVNSMTSGWTNPPKTVVAFDMQDSRIPERVRIEDQKQRSGGAGTDPEGFYYDGTVYLLASQLKTDADIARVLAHESLGHFGLRGLFGSSLKPILQQIATMRKAQVDAKMKEYGLKGVNIQDRLTAAEEVLAEMAQTTPTIGFVKRAIAAIRTWIRANIPGFKNMGLSDAEIIRDYILPARGWVERGEAANSGGSDIRYSLRSKVDDALNKRKTTLAGATTRVHTPEQLAAMRNTGFIVEHKSLKERAQKLRSTAWASMKQGIFDQFDPVKSISQEAYALLRLAKGASGAFETVLHGGKLKLADGVYDFDEAQRGGVVDKLLIPMQGEHHDFFRWVAANRAERLTTEDREHLFTEDDIAAFKTLADGDLEFDYTLQHGPRAGQTTRVRAEMFKDSLATFNGFNKNMLDLAEESGLIDGDSRPFWEHEFYVPFYRVADEEAGGVTGANVKNSAVRQEAFKTLKGGTNKLNVDLLDNVLMNWAHLLDASAKNRAAKATIEAAEDQGLATGGNQEALSQMGKAMGNRNGVVWFMDEGKKRYSLIDNADDGRLLQAISALEYSGMRSPIMSAMGAFKSMLTVGVTASPFFKVRNLIRDSLQVIGTSPIGVNPAANVKDGWKLTNPENDVYFRLLAGGGTIHFGTMYEGSEGKRVQALVESGVDAATILNDEHKLKKFYRKAIEPLMTAYNELGNRGEAVNRAALYDQLVKQGMTHAEASLMARDLMDFSMQGTFTAVRFLSQVVPFFNARLQGMYKLGRAANEDPRRMAATLGAISMFSLALLAAYGDDDDWKKREDWDRNNFWWFKFGDTAFRIPKPFELGAIATLAERSAELVFDDEMTGKRFREQVLRLVGDNLSMNPIPQLVKPIIDIYANKDSFKGTPIETMSQERLQPEYRFNDRTTMLARGASTALNAAAGVVGAQSLSPVQIDHLIRGYFGWLGTFVVGGADIVARPVTGQPERASSDIARAFTGGMVSDLRDAPSRYVSQMYDQAKELEQAFGTWRALKKEGKTLEAEEFKRENALSLGKYHGIEFVKRAQGKLNERIRVIERGDMNPDEKRIKIREIQARKDALARRVAN